jgi:cytochrome c biogenesis factor
LTGTLKVVFMMMKHFFLLLVFAGAAQVLKAQRTIEVRLYDAVMTPIAGVPVSVEGADLATTTDALGQFAFVDLPAQAQKFVFHIAGFPSLSIEIPEQKQCLIQLTAERKLKLLEHNRH